MKNPTKRLILFILLNICLIVLHRWAFQYQPIITIFTLSVHLLFLLKWDYKSLKQ